MGLARMTWNGFRPTSLERERKTVAGPGNDPLDDLRPSRLDQLFFETGLAQFICLLHGSFFQTYKAIGPALY
jgi:hypothetical protein